MQRVIVLANGRQIPLGKYVQGIKQAKANPSATFKHGLTGWWPVSGQEIVHEFFGMVQDLINRHLKIGQDRKGAATRLLRRLRAKGRQCRWCGQKFIPRALSERCCSVDCHRSYST
jgi:hypothetical protein